MRRPSNSRSIFYQSLAQKTECRAGAAGGVCKIAARIEDRIVPGLTLGIRAAAGSAHDVAGQQEGLGEPGVAAGEAYLKIAKEFEPELLRVATQLPVLPIQQKLGKGVGRDGLAVFGEEGSRAGPRFFDPPSGAGLPELPVERGLAASLPAPPVASAIVVTKGLVQAVPHEPAAVFLSEEGKLPGQLALPRP